MEKRTVTMPASMEYSRRSVPGTEGWRRAIGMVLFGLLMMGSLGEAAPAPSVEAYLQSRLTASQSSAPSLSLRRLKLVLDGGIGSTQYYLQALYKDGNHSATDGQFWVQEAWLRWPVAGGHLTVGQFKPPFGLERFTPDWNLDTIDRSLATDALIPNGKLDSGRGYARDRGVQWDSRLGGKRTWLAVGLFAGQGATTRQDRIDPLLASRMTWTAVAGRHARWTVGGAVSTRDGHDLDFSAALPGTRNLGYNHFNGRDTRWNLETSADTGDWHLRGEYFRAAFDASGGIPSLQASGYYLQCTYRARPRLLLTLKHEAIDPRLGVVDRNDVQVTTLGLTYLLDRHRGRLQANHLWRADSGPGQADDLWVAQFQQFF